MRQFSIKNIERSLSEVCRHFDEVNATLDDKREEMTPELVDNIVEAYRYLNGLLEKEIELFSPAGMFSILELNHIVLCGIRPEKRYEYHEHILSTRSRFQKNVRPILEWHKKANKKMEPYKLATNFYSLALSQPQLFIEGNHRTENVVINYILMNYDLPPFVLNLQNALEYLNISTKIKWSDKKSLLNNLTKMPDFQKKLRKILEKYGDNQYVE